jgi:hypothetical protein
MEKTELSISFSLCSELKLWGLCEKETDGPRAIMIQLCVCVCVLKKWAEPVEMAKAVCVFV